MIMEPAEMDFITDLHESVLRNILSRLPIKDAARTCILSKRWRYKWTLTDTVDINDHQAEVEMFSQAMNSILVMPRGLRSFQFRCGDFYDLSDVQRWMSNAVGRHLQYLNVRCEVDGVVFPSSLLNNSSLKEIILSNCSILDVGTNNYAPNLTSFELEEVEVVKKGDTNTSTVTFDFPVLENFSVHACRWLGLEALKINAPSLTEFSSTVPEDHQADENENDILFQIVAPRLAEFVCSLRLQEDFVLNGSSVVSAYVTCDEDGENLQLARENGLRMRKLLNELKNLEYLELSSLVAQLSQFGVFGHMLRVHKKLRQLYITGQSNCSELLELLHAAPSLQFLSINTLTWPDYAYGAVESVPSCIVSQLETVELYNFECGMEQYKLAEFLLKNGAQLKTLFIGTEMPAEKYIEIKEHLLAYTKASSCLRIIIDDFEDDEE